MIDQATIAVVPDRIQIRPNLIDDESPTLGSFLPIGYNRSNDAKKTENAMMPVFHSTFDLFADRALRVYTRSKERNNTDRSTQYVYLIELNLRKILWGHNGSNIQDATDLTNGLCIVRHALGHLLNNPEEASQLIPGVGQMNVSYWQKLEIAMDVADPEQAIRRRLDYMRSPSVRRKARHYPNTTVLDGKDVDIKAYDKLAQMTDRHKVRKKSAVAETKDPITRLEVVLKGKKLTELDGLDEALRPVTKEIESKPRLVGFTWNQLKAWHRSYFSKLKAVYHHTSKNDGSASKGYPAVLAALALEYEILPENIFEHLVAWSGKKKDTCRAVRRKMEEHLEQASELTVETLLSDEKYRYQPSIFVKGVEGVRFYVKHFGWSEINEPIKDIRKVYEDHPRPKFDPSILNKSYLEW